MGRVVTALKRGLGSATHRVHDMPVLTLMAHSACNCRCVMCDIWKANHDRRELSRDLLSRHVADMRALGVRWVVLSGGESLMHSNLWSLCELIHELPAQVTLLSTGLLLARHADAVAAHCDEVIVSLDGAAETHTRIRNVPRAYERLGEGVAALRAVRADMPISGRCVLHRMNFRELPQIIDAAAELGLDRISFLAADLTSEAFNRPEAWDEARVSDLSLSPEEVTQFGEVLDAALETHADAFESGFVAESPLRLRRLVDYYAAQNGEGAFPAIRCNAPWVSAVIEADGAVRPCFFHRSFGSIHDRPLREIVNSPEMIAFRKALDVDTDETCKRCVCTLHLSPLASPTAGSESRAGSRVESRAESRAESGADLKAESRAER